MEITFILTNLNKKDYKDMKYEFNSKEELFKFISENILDSSEAIDLLGCSRQNFNRLVNNGKIAPIKRTSRNAIFLKEDVINRK